MKKLISSETTFCSDQYSPGLAIEDLNYLKDKYFKSERRRHRLCFHQNTEILLHDIVIIYDSKSYIPPNKHIGKSETIVLLQGELEFFIFNDRGEPFFGTKLSATDKQYPFIIRVPPNTWHGLRCISEEPCIVKETITGPYWKESLKWAEFAPSEVENSSSKKGFEWYESVAKKLTNYLSVPPKIQYTKISENVVISENQIPFVNSEICEVVKKLGKSSPLKRARFCLHPTENDLLQEMVIFLDKGCDIPESYHVSKDESLLVIEGYGKYDFTHNDGSVATSYHLSTFSEAQSSSRCFTRINRFSAHKIIPGPEGILIYEATTGPFRKEDTAYLIPSIVNSNQ
jgi:cupin fold WbuC family metalloprotein